MRIKLALATALATLCLSASGCRTEKQPAPPREQVDGADQGSIAAVASVAHPEELLPANTVAYFVGKSPRRAAEVFGRDRVAQQFPDLYRTASDFSNELVGYDVLDPSSLPKMGIDPDGRTGIAVLSVDPEAFAFFVTLSDPGRFRQIVVEIAARHDVSIVPTSLGGSEILGIGRDGAVVIRGNFAVIIGGNGDVVPQVSQAVATIDPSRALASTRTYRRTIGSTAPGDLVGFVDAAEILQQSTARRSKFAQEHLGGPSWQEKELEEARQRGEPAERIQELEARAREQREWDDRWKKREEAQQALSQRLFASIEAMGLRVDAKPSGAVFEVRMPMPEDGFLRRLLKEGKGPPALSWALDGSPLLLLAGNVDVGALVELVDLFAQAEGSSYAQLSDELKKTTGLDLATLQPLLTGTMGGAITLDGKIDLSAVREGPPSWLGFTVHAELSDPAAVEGLLGTVVGKVKPFGKAPRREAGKGEYSFEIPDWRRVYVTVAGRHLVVTTDRLLPERLAKGKAGNVDKKTKPSGAYAAMSLPDASLTYASDTAAFGWLMFAGLSSSSMMHASIESPETESIPKSRTWQKKKKELEKVEERLRQLQRERETARMKESLDIVRSTGMTVFVTKRDEQGLWATGGQFVRADGIAGAVVDVIAATQKLRAVETNAANHEELDRLFTQSMNLQRELEEIRRADIERALSRKKR